MNEQRWLMICGGPRTGKSTLARKCHTALGTSAPIHTDNFLHLTRAERPESIARVLKHRLEAGEQVALLEGCEAPRLLDRLSLFDLPDPYRVVWVGPTDKDLYPPQHRAIVSTQLNKIQYAIDRKILSHYNWETDEGNLIYVPTHYDPESGKPA